MTDCPSKDRLIIDLSSSYLYRLIKEHWMSTCGIQKWQAQGKLKKKHFNYSMSELQLKPNFCFNIYCNNIETTTTTLAITFLMNCWLISFVHIERVISWYSHIQIYFLASSYKSPSPSGRYRRSQNCKFAASASETFLKSNWWLAYFPNIAVSWYWKINQRESSSSSQLD